MQPDRIWPSLGITKEFLDEKAAWLSEQRELDDRVALFFIEAGKLVEFSWYHYPFASLAFFQSIIAVEKSLRLLDRKPELSFKDLFTQVVKEAFVSDGAFSQFEMEKSLKRQVKGKTQSHLELLSLLIPELRNDFVHGTYLLSPDFLYLCFQMRELADALCPEIRRRKPPGLR